MHKSYERLTSLGVPTPHQTMLLNHHEAAAEHIYGHDEGPSEALEWITANLNAAIGVVATTNMLQLVNNDTLAPEYIEIGYDSNQSHRNLSKKVSELILLGGIGYEFDLLGITLSPSEIADLVCSNAVLDEPSAEILKQIAKNFGAKQDFLFPGVVPSSQETLGLDEYAYLALAGTPLTTVRNLTGVGGLRKDADWNYVTDLPTFAKLKVTEDKRYYPGLGIFYALQLYEPDDIPAVKTLATSNNEAYSQVIKLTEEIKSASKLSYSGVSILCSAYIPRLHEVKSVHADMNSLGIDLSHDFHSPSYEFTALKKLFEMPHKTADLRDISAAVKKCWSFNSTVHLPWTAQLSSMSNGLIGAITNHAGDSSVRYGVGFNGKSIEIRQITVGAKRTIGSTLACHDIQPGAAGYILKYYPKSDIFQGECHSTDVPKETWQKIKDIGFMATFLQELKDE